MDEGGLTLEYIERRNKFKKRVETNLNNKVLDGLKQLGRCANRNIYAYDEKQVERLFLEIDTAVAEMKRAFTSTGGEKGRWVEI